MVVEKKWEICGFIDLKEKHGHLFFLENKKKFVLI